MPGEEKMHATRRFAHLVAAIALLLAAPPSPSRAETPSGPAERDAAMTILHLTETAERVVKRDRLRVELRVEATGSDPARLQAEVNRRMTMALERAKAVASVTVETGGYIVYEDASKSGAARWRGSQSLALTGRDFAPLLQLTGELQGDGLLASGMSFALARETMRAAEDEMTAEALRRLRERAERVAGEMGLTVLRLRDLRVGNADGGRGPGPVPMRAMTTMAGAPAPPPVAEAGEAIVRLSVEADILLGAAETNRP
jgi:predicted secreted protein